MELFVFMGFFVCLFLKKNSGFMGLLEIELVTGFMGLFLRFIYGLVSWIYFLFHVSDEKFWVYGFARD